MTEQIPVHKAVPADARVSHGWRRGALILLLLCLAIQLALPLATLPRHLSWDYGEGWNAYWAARAMAGEPLYTGPASTITNNYLPLSFYISGWAGRLAGDTIVGGRLLSLASLLACAALIGVAARRLGAGREWAIAGALAFLLYVASFAWRYVASDDPQWLAAAVSFAGLLLLLRSDDEAPQVRRIVAAAALMLLAGLIKHNQLAAPIAATMWLARFPRRGLGPWLATCAALAAASLLLLHWRFGPILFAEVLGHHRTFRLGFFINSVQTLSGLFPEMGLAFLLWRERPAPAGSRLLLLFALAATMLGILERFGTGVAVNAHFDAAIGLVAVGTVAIGRETLWPSEKTRRVMALMALLPLLVATTAMLPRTIERLRTLDQVDGAWDRAIGLVRSAPGPVACELPALCYWAGRPLLFDFYNYGQKIRTIGDPAGLLGQIAQRRFALMMVVRDRRYREGDGRLPDSYNALIERTYRPMMLLPDYGLMLVPALSGRDRAGDLAPRA